ncbi:MAG: serine/threonine-protein kinase [Myxococcota bacterium]
MDRTLPRYLGPYCLVRRVGHGGMCEVYLAMVYGASGFEKRVAIKTLLPECQGNASMERLLIKEATIGAQLQHRNLVQIHDFGSDEGVYYVRMDYVEGADLLTLIRKEQPAPALALLIAEEIALALDYVHRCTDSEGRPLGLVHRDISPSNILLSVSGEVKLADFGVAKATKLADVTQGNIRKGKYAYMSPEQVASDELTPRSDQFGLAITLMEMLCGRRPFDGASPLATMDRIRAGDPPDLSDLKPEFRPLIARCLNHSPNARYPSAGSLYRALARLRHNLPPAGSPALGAWVRKLTQET